MKKVLIISNDTVNSRMGGVGIRNWELAHALAPHCQVTLAVPDATDLASDTVNLVVYPGPDGDLRPLASQADVILIQGFVLHFHPYLREMQIPLAVDLYVPFLLEGLVWHAENDWQSWIPHYEEYLRVQLEQLRAGDFFFCASETQRDYWLGWLHAQKRINPHTYRQDAELRKLIDVVPFGLPAQPAQPTRPVLKDVHPGINQGDTLILWSGGLWDWLDPLTFIRAVARLIPAYPRLKVYFMGTQHPNPIVTGMSMPEKALALSRELDLLNSHIFFGDWTPYQERLDYLLEADFTVISHPQHIETHFSFRTRLLDCIWASLPVIITQGDTMAEWVERENLGYAIPPHDEQAMAAAIEKMIAAGRSFGSPRAAFAPAFARLRPTLQWENVIQPLLQFCLNPSIAPDKDQYLTEAERVTQAKDAFIEQVIRDKDAYLEQVIRDKDAHLEHVVHEKEAFLEQVVSEKDAFLEQVVREKDHCLEQVTSEKDDRFEQMVQEKDAQIAAYQRMFAVRFQNRLTRMLRIKARREKTQTMEAPETPSAAPLIAPETSHKPFVSIVIVNYNGAHFLPACLEALQAQTYPADCFEVLVSDNGSSDDSLDLLSRNFPWVKVLENKKNLGFASGNNVAIAAAQGEYIILLNNDTTPQPDWIEQMVATAEQHPQAGMLTGHLQLFYDQLELEFQAEAFSVPGDGRELGFQLFGVESNTPRGVIQYLEGFYGPEAAGKKSFRWSRGIARLGVPVPPGSGDWQIDFQLAAYRPENRPVHLRVYLQGSLQAEWEIIGDQPDNFTLTLPASTRSMAQPIAQNTGSIITREGYSRDRGTYVKDYQVFYEPDQGQYDQVEEVFSGCGASLLLRRAMLQEIGPIDDDFFMYYEDTDLAWRAWLHGWKVIFAAPAIVRHIHCGTTKEWSPFFLYLIDRNRLAMIFKNGTTAQILQSWGRYAGSAGKNLLRTIWAWLSRKKYWRDQAAPLRLQLRVLGTLVKWLPALMRKRSRNQSTRKVHPQEVLERWFLESF
ncbi:MAG: glycosyltransferase [Anaerolineales bacterium]|nr:glycosyltransferase [Anaerolineales bacterium]